MMMTFDQIFAGAVALLLIFYYNWSRWSMYVAAAKIPGENGLPLLGNIHKMFFSWSNENIFGILHKTLETYGSPAKTWYGNILSIYVDQPEQLQVILNSNKCLQKAHLYKFLGVNFGLIAADGE